MTAALNMAGAPVAARARAARASFDRRAERRRHLASIISKVMYRAEHQRE